MKLLIAIAVVATLALQAISGYFLIENVKESEVYKRPRLEFVLSDEYLTEDGKKWRHRFLLYHAFFWCAIGVSILESL